MSLAWFGRLYAPRSSQTATVSPLFKRLNQKIMDFGFEALSDSVLAQLVFPSWMQVNERRCRVVQDWSAPRPIGDGAHFNLRCMS
jgi:hypothetical protein